MSALPGLTQASLGRGCPPSPSKALCWAGLGVELRVGPGREGAGKSSSPAGIKKTQVLLILNLVLVDSQVDTGPGHQTPDDLIPPQPKSRTKLDQLRAPDAALLWGRGNSPARLEAERKENLEPRVAPSLGRRHFACRVGRLLEPGRVFNFFFLFFFPLWSSQIRW